MSTPQERVKAFFATLDKDPSLQARVKAAADADSVVIIAKDAGFEFPSSRLGEFQTNAFFTWANKNPLLLKHLKSTRSPQEVVAIAREHGYIFSPKHLTNFLETTPLGHSLQYLFNFEMA